MVLSGFIQLETNSFTVNENNGEVIITLLRVDGSEGEASVNYSTADGSGVNGLDYISQEGTLIFAPGETSKTISIPIIDDDIVEGNETFSFLIGESVGAELGLPRTAIITIEDNDVEIKSTVSFSQAEYSIAENGTEAIITLVREGAIDTTVSVDFATVDDYAKGNSSQYADYLSVAQTITFASGETSKTVTIPILDDSLSENDESLNLVLSNPVNIDLGVQSQTTLTIVNDDELPSGFSRETLVRDLDRPTGFDWLDRDKILIAELEGKLRVFDQGTGQLLETPFLDLSDTVNTSGQRGLLSLAVHPDFPNSPYVYLGYTYDPPELVNQVGADQGGPRDTRLIRVTADPSTNYTTAIPGSEVVLMTIPNTRSFHASAGIRFGNDGSLFYAHGDGNVVGSVISNPENFTRLDYPFGKLYRINPITGEGYEDNPFYTGNVEDIESKVYSYGFRNPFRIAIHPETGEPYIGDVGLSTWEEVNTGRGANFGWPFFEGGNGTTLRNPQYSNNPRFQDFYNSNPDVTAPIYARNHSDNFTAVILGDFYTGDAYPDLFQGALFLADFGLSRKVEALILDEQGNVETSILFDQLRDSIIQMSMGPDGYLYAVSFDLRNPGQSPGNLTRWTYQPPEPIVIQGTAGRDNLSGTDSAEIIKGLGGADTLIGGGGNDEFTYTSVLDGGDIIRDFVVGEDKINLAEVFNSANYIGSNPINEGWITFSSRNSSSLILLDLDGSEGLAKPRSFIRVEGVNVEALNNLSNFIL